MGLWHCKNRCSKRSFCSLSVLIVLHMLINGVCNGIRDSRSPRGIYHLPLDLLWRVWLYKHIPQCSQHVENRNKWFNVKHILDSVFMNGLTDRKYLNWWDFCSDPPTSKIKASKNWKKWFEPFQRLTALLLCFFDASDPTLNLLLKPFEHTLASETGSVFAQSRWLLRSR